MQATISRRRPQRQSRYRPTEYFARGVVAVFSDLLWYLYMLTRPALTCGGLGVGPSVHRLSSSLHCVPWREVLLASSSFALPGPWPCLAFSLRAWPLPRYRCCYKEVGLGDIVVRVQSQMRWSYSTNCLAGISILSEIFDEEEGKENKPSSRWLGTSPVPIVLVILVCHHFP